MGLATNDLSYTNPRAKHVVFIKKVAPPVTPQRRYFPWAQDECSGLIKKRGGRFVSLNTGAVPLVPPVSSASQEMFVIRVAHIPSWA